MQSVTLTLNGVQREVSGVLPHTTLLNWLRSQLKIPVLTNLPYGHVATKVLLPVGARVDLAVEGRDALLVWGHIIPR